MPDERVTVTLPEEMVKDIDRQERNRSKFVRGAVRNELERRRREALRRSLGSPHPESGEVADLGLEEWLSAQRPEDEGLVDPVGGREVRWTPGSGWAGTDE